LVSFGAERPISEKLKKNRVIDTLPWSARSLSKESSEWHAWKSIHNPRREEDVMKRWKEKLEAMAAAVSFAEAGDWDTARELLRDRAEDKIVDRREKRTHKTDRPRARIYRT
jgi:hypothetical protein